MQGHLLAKKIGLWLVVLSLCGLLGACGYHCESRPAYWSPKWQTIAIPVFENPTAEIRLGAILASALRDRLTLSRLFKLAPLAQADVVLQGKILFVSISGLSYNVYTQTLERRVTVRVKIRLVERTTNKTIWEGVLNRFQDYPVVSGQGETFDPGREEALEEMSRDLADIVYHKLVARF